MPLDTKISFLVQNFLTALSSWSIQENFPAQFKLVNSLNKNLQFATVMDSIEIDLTQVVSDGADEVTLDDRKARQLHLQTELWLLRFLDPSFKINHSNERESAQKFFDNFSDQPNCLLNILLVSYEHIYKAIQALNRNPHANGYLTKLLDEFKKKQLVIGAKITQLRTAAKKDVEVDQTIEFALLAFDKVMNPNVSSPLNRQDITAMKKYFLQQADGNFQAQLKVEQLFLEFEFDAQLTLPRVLIKKIQHECSLLQKRQKKLKKLCGALLNKEPKNVKDLADLLPYFILFSVQEKTKWFASFEKLPKSDQTKLANIALSVETAQLTFVKALRFGLLSQWWSALKNPKHGAAYRGSEFVRFFCLSDDVPVKQHNLRQQTYTSLLQDDPSSALVLIQHIKKQNQTATELFKPDQSLQDIAASHPFFKDQETILQNFNSQAKKAAFSRLCDNIPANRQFLLEQFCDEHQLVALLSDEEGLTWFEKFFAEQFAHVRDSYLVASVFKSGEKKLWQAMSGILLTLTLNELIELYYALGKILVAHACNQESLSEVLNYFNAEIIEKKLEICVANNAFFIEAKEGKLKDNNQLALLKKCVYRLPKVAQIKDLLNRCNPVVWVDSELIVCLLKRLCQEPAEDVNVDELIKKITEAFKSGSVSHSQLLIEYFYLISAASFTQEKKKQIREKLIASFFDQQHHQRLVALFDCPSAELQKLLAFNLKWQNTFSWKVLQQFIIGLTSNFSKKNLEAVLIEAIDALSLTLPDFTIPAECFNLPEKLRIQLAHHLLKAHDKEPPRLVKIFSLLKHSPKEFCQALKDYEFSLKDIVREHPAEREINYQQEIRQLGELYFSLSKIDKFKTLWEEVRATSKDLAKICGAVESSVFSLEALLIPLVDQNAKNKAFEQGVKDLNSAIANFTIEDHSLDDDIAVVKENTKELKNKMSKITGHEYLRSFKEDFQKNSNHFRMAVTYLGSESDSTNDALLTEQLSDQSTVTRILQKIQTAFESKERRIYAFQTLADDDYSNYQGCYVFINKDNKLYYITYDGRKISIEFKKNKHEIQFRKDLQQRVSVTDAAKFSKIKLFLMSAETAYALAEKNKEFFLSDEQVQAHLEFQAIDYETAQWAFQRLYKRFLNDAKIIAVFIKAATRDQLLWLETVPAELLVEERVVEKLCNAALDFKHLSGIFSDVVLANSKTLELFLKFAPAYYFSALTEWSVKKIPAALLREDAIVKKIFSSPLKPRVKWDLFHQAILEDEKVFTVFLDHVPEGFFASAVLHYDSLMGLQKQIINFITPLEPLQAKSFIVKRLFLFELFFSKSNDPQLQPLKSDFFDQLANKQLLTELKIAQEFWLQVDDDFLLTIKLQVQEIFLGYEFSVLINHFYLNYFDANSHKTTLLLDLIKAKLETVSFEELMCCYVSCSLDGQEKLCDLVMPYVEAGSIEFSDIQLLTNRLTALTDLRLNTAPERMREMIKQKISEINEKIRVLEEEAKEKRRQEENLAAMVADEQQQQYLSNLLAENSTEPFKALLWLYELLMGDAHDTATIQAAISQTLISLADQTIFDLEAIKNLFSCIFKYSQNEDALLGDAYELLKLLLGKLICSQQLHFYQFFLKSEVGVNAKGIMQPIFFNAIVASIETAPNSEIEYLDDCAQLFPISSGENKVTAALKAKIGAVVTSGSLRSFEELLILYQMLINYPLLFSTEVKDLMHRVASEVIRAFRQAISTTTFRFSETQFRMFFKVLLFNPWADYKNDIALIINNLQNARCFWQYSLKNDERLVDLSCYSFDQMQRFSEAIDAPELLQDGVFQAAAVHYRGAVIRRNVVRAFNEMAGQENFICIPKQLRFLFITCATEKSNLNQTLYQGLRQLLKKPVNMQCLWKFILDYQPINKSVDSECLLGFILKYHSRFFDPNNSETSRQHTQLFSASFKQYLTNQPLFQLLRWMSQLISTKNYTGIIKQSFDELFASLPELLDDANSIDVTLDEIQQIYFNIEYMLADNQKLYRLFAEMALTIFNQAAQQTNFSCSAQQLIFFLKFIATEKNEAHKVRLIEKTFAALSANSLLILFKQVTEKRYKEIIRCGASIRFNVTAEPALLDPQIAGELSDFILYVRAFKEKKPLVQTKNNIIKSVESLGLSALSYFLKKSHQTFKKIIRPDLLRIYLTHFENKHISPQQLAESLVLILQQQQKALINKKLQVALRTQLGQYTPTDLTKFLETFKTTASGPMLQSMRENFDQFAIDCEHQNFSTLLMLSSFHHDLADYYQNQLRPRVLSVFSSEQVNTEIGASQLGQLIRWLFEQKLDFQSDQELLEKLKLKITDYSASELKEFLQHIISGEDISILLEEVNPIIFDLSTLSAYPQKQLMLNYFKHKNYQNASAFLAFVQYTQTTHIDSSMFIAIFAYFSLLELLKISSHLLALKLNLLELDGALEQAIAQKKAAIKEEAIDAAQVKEMLCHLESIDELAIDDGLQDFAALLALSEFENDRKNYYEILRRRILFVFSREQTKNDIGPSLLSQFILWLFDREIAFEHDKDLLACLRRHIATYSIDELKEFLMSLAEKNIDVLLEEVPPTVFTLLELPAYPHKKFVIDYFHQQENQQAEKFVAFVQHSPKIVVAPQIFEYIFQVFSLVELVKIDRMLTGQTLNHPGWNEALMEAIRLNSFKVIVDDHQLTEVLPYLSVHAQLLKDQTFVAAKKILSNMTFEALTHYCQQLKFSHLLTLSKFLHEDLMANYYLQILKPRILAIFARNPHARIRPEILLQLSSWFVENKLNVFEDESLLNILKAQVFLYSGDKLTRFLTCLSSVFSKCTDLILNLPEAAGYVARITDLFLDAINFKNLQLFHLMIFPNKKLFIAFFKQKQHQHASEFLSFLKDDGVLEAYRAELVAEILTFFPLVEYLKIAAILSSQPSKNDGNKDHQSAWGELLLQHIRVRTPSIDQKLLDYMLSPENLDLFDDENFPTTSAFIAVLEGNAAEKINTEALVLGRFSRWFFLNNAFPEDRVKKVLAWLKNQLAGYSPRQLAKFLTQLKEVHLAGNSMDRLFDLIEDEKLSLFCLSENPEHKLIVKYFTPNARKKAEEFLCFIQYEPKILVDQDVILEIFKFFPLTELLKMNFALKQQSSAPESWHASLVTAIVWKQDSITENEAKSTLDYLFFSQDTQTNMSGVACTSEYGFSNGQLFDAVHLPMVETLLTKLTPKDLLSFFSRLFPKQQMQLAKVIINCFARIDVNETEQTQFLTDQQSKRQFIYFYKKLSADADTLDALSEITRLFNLAGFSLEERICTVQGRSNMLSL